MLALGGLPAVFLLARGYSVRLFPTMAQLQRRSADLASVVEEAVGGVRVVKGFGAEPVQEERLADAADQVHETGTSALLIRSRYLPAMEIAPTSARCWSWPTAACSSSTTG